MIRIPESVIGDIRRVAKYGTFGGRMNSPTQMAYMQRCTHLHAAITNG